MRLDQHERGRPGHPGPDAGQLPPGRTGRVGPGRLLRPARHTFDAQLIVTDSRRGGPRPPSEE
jgi:hypothetical protein